MQTKPTNIEALSFTTDDGLGTRARIGLIVLQSDQTVEHEFSMLVRGKEVVLYHARIPNAMEVNTETLQQMEQDLPYTAALLPASFNFDAIGYACTSGATMIGEAQVDQIIGQIHPRAKISNPISACKAALQALGLHRIAVVTPYAPEVTLGMQNNLNSAGFLTNAIASFNQSDDFTVARISADSILQAVLRIGKREDCEAVFVSCTSLRALEILNEAESILNKPVISSNQVLAWHLMRLCGLTDNPGSSGRLFNLS